MENRRSLPAGTAMPHPGHRNDWPLPQIPQPTQQSELEMAPDDAALYQRSVAGFPEERGDTVHQYDAWRDADLGRSQISHSRSQSASNVMPDEPTRAREFEFYRFGDSTSQRQPASGEIEPQTITQSGSDTSITGRFAPGGNPSTSTAPPGQQIVYGQRGGPPSSERPLPLPSMSLHQSRHWDTNVVERESVVARWQPDAEVTLCPICGTQFSFFVRKHHCRKCGRVVCNACSPHRITIPYQYIVRPPTESEPLVPDSVPTRPVRDSIHSISSTGFASLGGGERVRLCNPCVPDPNIAPPQSGLHISPPSNFNSSTPYSFSHPAGHSRSSSTITSPYGQYQRPQHLANRQSTPISVRGLRTPTRRPREPSILGPSQQHPSSQNLPSRGASYNTIEDRGFGGGLLDSRSRSNTTGADSRDIYDMGNNPSRPNGQSSSSQRRSSRNDTDLSQQPAQPPRQILEEDECWVCHNELPSRLLPDFETLRSQHVEACIASVMHSSLPPSAAAPTHPNRSSSSVHTISSMAAQTPSPEPRSSVQARRTGVFPYTATEKDCVDDAECTICLEEFEVGVEMGRLECFCRFHLRCIREWFASRPGKCPVHQHGGGY